MLLAQCPPSSWAPDHPARALGDICIWRAHLQRRISKPESVTAPSTLPTLFLPPTPSASSVSISGTIDRLVIWFHSFLSSAISVPIAVNGKDVSGSRFRPSPPTPPSAPIARPGLPSLQPLFSLGSVLLKEPYSPCLTAPGSPLTLLPSGPFHSTPALRTLWRHSMTAQKIHTWESDLV